MNERIYNFKIAHSQKLPKWFRQRNIYVTVIINKAQTKRNVSRTMRNCNIPIYSCAFRCLKARTLWIVCVCMTMICIAGKWKARVYCVREKHQPYNMFETIYCLLLPCQGVKTPAEYWTTKNLNDLMRKPSLRLIRAPVKRLYVDGHHIRWIFCRLKLFYIVFCFGFICKSKRSKKWIQLLISAQHRIYVVKFIRFSLEVWLVGQLKYGATIE